MEAERGDGCYFFNDEKNVTLLKKKIETLPFEPKSTQVKYNRIFFYASYIISYVIKYGKLKRWSGYCN